MDLSTFRTPIRNYDLSSVLRIRHFPSCYLIQVSKPDLPAGARSPALYLTDGNVNFGLVSGIAWPESMLGRDLEPAFIVGIGYPVSSIGDWFNARIDDLTPVPVKDPDLDPKVGSSGFRVGLRAEGC